MVHVFVPIRHNITGIILLARKQKHIIAAIKLHVIKYQLVTHCVIRASYLSREPDKRRRFSPSKQMVVIVFWWFENPVRSLPPPRISQTLMMLLPKTITQKSTQCEGHFVEIGGEF